MKTTIQQLLLVILATQLFSLSGCYHCATSLRKTMTEARVEKEAHAAFVPGSKIVVHDNDGAIRITAAEGTDCHVTGTVFVHAPTKREAREIAEQVRIVAEPNEGTLVIRVKKPPMPQEHRFVSVDLDVLIPPRAQVDCDTSFGRITLTGIEGDVKATTQFGRIVGRDIASGHLVARSQKGSIDIACAEVCPPEMVADVSTQWGKVCFRTPPEYRGTLDLDSDLGAVKLRTAADIRGTITRGKVSGRIGSGAGSLRLFTNLGSVTLR